MGAKLPAVDLGNTTAVSVSVGYYYACALLVQRQTLRGGIPKVKCQVIFRLSAIDTHKNGSKTALTAQRTRLGYPHEGPSAEMRAGKLGSWGLVGLRVRAFGSGQWTVRGGGGSVEARDERWGLERMVCESSGARMVDESGGGGGGHWAEIAGGQEIWICGGVVACHSSFLLLLFYSRAKR